MRMIAVSVAVAALMAACGSQTEAPAAPVEEAPAAQAAQTAPTAPVSAAEEAEARANEGPATFPAGYRGEWDFNDDGCAKDESGTRFVITANEIKGYEDTSKLTALEVLEGEGDAIRVVLDNQSSDGDVTFTQIMRLSPVAGISLRIERDGRTIRANRCDPV